ncbi:MAG: MFS transporter, partial [Sedimenticola sp.]|nr:MFS transporter [Sedimenticola sp.]
LGRLADAAQRRRGGWRVLVTVATLCLLLAYLALFNPPSTSGGWLGAWFGASLVLVYTAHSALNITYLAWGARASEQSFERTRLVAFREGFALLGVILASLLPMLLVEQFGVARGWWLFSLVFCAVLLPAVWLLLRHAPLPGTAMASMAAGLLQPLRHVPFRRLALLFLLNGFAVAIAATLSLFYIADVLRLEAVSGYLLAIYFISGACSLPFWLWIARRLGRPIAWLLGSLLAVTGFIWALQLGAGDLLPYAVICLLSGAALGADLAMPAAIAADLIPSEERGRSASYFGIWSLINKLVLALAAGLALPLLAGFGYQPGGSGGLAALALFYAGIPCLIKLFSALLLLRWRHSLEVPDAA